MPPKSLCYWLWLGVLGCRSAPPAHPAVAASCTAERVGTVMVVGAKPSAVPALAILEGTFDDPERTERIARTAEEALRWRGYANAEITVSRPRSERRCFTDLQVAVELGPRFEISRIEFETDDAFPAAERLAVIEDALGTVNTVGGVHIAYRLRRALAGLQRRYRDAGWIDATIAEPAATYDARGRVRLTIRVDAGERYRIGTIRARGGNSIVRAQVLDELGIAAGAWYDAQVIRRGLERARRSVDRRVDVRLSAGAGEIELEAIVEARR